MIYNRFDDPRHKAWARKVKERDKFRCRVCDKNQCYLHAHHLNSWNVFEEHRFLVENGITLCAKCHGSFHDIYGSGNNTYLQFREFWDLVKLLKQIAEEEHERRVRRFNRSS